MHVEGQFEISELIRVIIPKTTIDLLKAQKGSAGQTNKKKGKLLVSLIHSLGSKSPLSPQDANFNPQQCQYYVFQLVCKDKTVEYVVEGYLPFKYITAAFEDLINQRDSIARINERISIYQDGQLQEKSNEPSVQE